jgi:hypothetical protein
MRTITISAALSAGLMVSQAMADQGNWVESAYGTYDYDTVVAGAYGSFGGRVCRAVVDVGSWTKYPGEIVPSGCSVNLAGVATIDPKTLIYERLAPAQQSASGGAIPTNATNKGAHGVSKFGNPGAPLYFCRADLGGWKGVQLGSLAPGSSGCLIPYGGTTQNKSTYEVLVDLSPNRLPLTTANVSSGGSIPFDALAGGYDTDGLPLYYCQASYGGAVVPGKTAPKFGSCDIPWQGSEIYVPSYQVLVPLWKDTSLAAFTFPAYTYPNLAKIHVGRATPTGSSSLFPGRYSPSTDPNWCYLSNGSAVDKRVRPFQILSE